MYIFSKQLDRAIGFFLILSGGILLPLAFATESYTGYTYQLAKVASILLLTVSLFKTTRMADRRLTGRIDMGKLSLITFVVLLFSLLNIFLWHHYNITMIVLLCVCSLVAGYAHLAKPGARTFSRN